MHSVEAAKARNLPVISGCGYRYTRIRMHLSPDPAPPGSGFFCIRLYQDFLNPPDPAKYGSIRIRLIWIRTNPDSVYSGFASIRVRHNPGSALVFDLESFHLSPNLKT
jgi:hypothetical protein